MSAWIQHLWSKRPQTEKVLEKVQDTLADLYLRGDSEIQGCIVYAVLENVFSDNDMRIIFKSWKKKQQLREAYDTALEYATRLQEVPDSVMQDVMNKMGKGNV